MLEAVISIFKKDYSSSELYKSLFENSKSVMLLINPATGSIIDANIAACNFYQYPKRDLLSFNIMEINIFSEIEVKREMENAKNESRNNFLFKHKLSTGEVRDVEVFSSPVTIDNNKILYSIINDVTEKLRLAKEKEEIIIKLQKANEEIKTLRGIIPICSYCKKIRNDEGAWEIMEAYISTHSGAQFSHGACPECYKKQIEEL